MAHVDVGDPRLRAGIEGFMPFSFESVNAQCKRYLAIEGRQVGRDERPT